MAMLAEAAGMGERDHHALSLVTRHLRGGDPVIRAAAARALGSFDMPEAAGALAAALLDEDPDVRADAMAALTGCATPRERAAILSSLRGDPVAEVKTAAIQVLARLGGDEARELVLRLVSDRAEDEITWDDTESVWDDWLDIQLAAIEALGAMQVVEAIPVFLAARQDEFGQDLDGPVFAALAGMGTEGLTALLALARDTSPKTSARALQALGKAAPGTLEPMAEALVREDNEQIRLIGLSALPPDSPDIERLVLEDPAVEVRSAALRTHGESRPDLIAKALGDPSERVVGTALELLLSGPITAGLPDLTANLEAWASRGSGVLLRPAIKLLARLSPGRAAPLLGRIAQGKTQDLTDRIAAIALIPGTDAFDAENLAPLPTLLEAPERQIRLAALTSLAQLLSHHSAGIRVLTATLLATVIAGEVTPEAAAAEKSTSEPDLAAPKGDPVTPGRISITPEGEIIQGPELDEKQGADNVIPVAFPRSTLDALQDPAVTREADKGAIRPRHRRRVAVTGCENHGTDLRISALNVLPETKDEKIDQAVIAALDGALVEITAAALRAIRRRGLLAETTIAETVKPLLVSPDLAIKLAAVEACADMPSTRAWLVDYVTDPNPNIRAQALSALIPAMPDLGQSALDDPSSFVRQTAARELLASGQIAMPTLIRRLIKGGTLEPLKAIGADPAAVRRALLDLVGEVEDDRAALCRALDGLAYYSAHRG
ncbi:MAG: HEAT repeat domain-containing protein [Pseudomonadota bacterium]